MISEQTETKQHWPFLDQVTLVVYVVHSIMSFSLFLSVYVVHSIMSFSLVKFLRLPFAAHVWNIGNIYIRKMEDSVP